MSVLIKMDMPKSCSECPCEYDSFRCNVTGTKFWDIEDFDVFTQRLPNCPLVEIKIPHGRLIDAEQLKRDNPRHMEADVPYVTEVTVEEIIDDAPTVVEAEN